MTSDLIFITQGTLLTEHASQIVYKYLECLAFPSNIVTNLPKYSNLQVWLYVQVIQSQTGVGVPVLLWSQKTQNSVFETAVNYSQHINILYSATKIT